MAERGAASTGCCWLSVRDARGPTGSHRPIPGGPRSNGWQMSNDHTTTAGPGGISQAYSLTWLFLSSSSLLAPFTSPSCLFPSFSRVACTYPLTHARTLGIESSCAHWNAKLAPRAKHLFLTWHTCVCTRVRSRIRGPPRGPGEWTGRTHRCYGTTGRTLVKSLVAARPPSPAVKVALATAETARIPRNSIHHCR